MSRSHGGFVAGRRSRLGCGALDSFGGHGVRRGMGIRLPKAGLAVALLCGCAHYGWSAEQAPVSVPTVAVAGDSGLNPSALTRRMVEQLQSHGYAAVWGGEEDRSFSCSVEIVADGAGARGWAPVAEAACVDGAQTVRARGVSHAQLTDSTANDIRTLQQDAALRAIDAVAAELARELHNQRPSD